MYGVCRIVRAVCVCDCVCEEGGGLGWGLREE